MFHRVASLILLAAVQGCSTAVPRAGSAWVEGAPVAAAVTAVGPQAAQAEDEAPLFPLPFTPDFTRGGGWGLAFGAGVEYENAYSGSDEYGLEVDPALAVQWRTGNHLFSWEGLGFRGLLARTIDGMSRSIWGWMVNVKRVTRMTAGSTASTTGMMCSRARVS